MGEKAEASNKVKLAYCHDCNSLMFQCPKCGKWHHVKAIVPTSYGTVCLETSKEESDEDSGVEIDYAELKKAERKLGLKKR